MQSLDGVESVAVVYHAQTKSLVAFMSPLELNLQAVRKQMHNNLPSRMIPGLFFTVEKLPMLSSSKIDRVGLRSLASKRINGRKFAPIPEDEIPKTELEIFFKDQMSKILDNTPIGIYTNFTEVGADSLQIITLLTAVQKKYGVQISALSNDKGNIHNYTKLIMKSTK